MKSLSLVLAGLTLALCTLVANSDKTNGQGMCTYDGECPTGQLCLQYQQAGINMCFGPRKLNETCEYTRECALNDENAICVKDVTYQQNYGHCKCQNGFEMDTS
jgi:hypothetical protein